MRVGDISAEVSHSKLQSTSFAQTEPKHSSQSVQQHNRSLVMTSRSAGLYLQLDNGIAPGSGFKASMRPISYLLLGWRLIWGGRGTVPLRQVCALCDPAQDLQCVMVGAAPQCEKRRRQI
jgi:hypothetical protein